MWRPLLLTLNPILDPSYVWQQYSACAFNGRHAPAWIVFLFVRGYSGKQFPQPHTDCHRSTSYSGMRGGVGGGGSTRLACMLSVTDRRIRRNFIWRRARFISLKHPCSGCNPRFVRLHARIMHPDDAFFMSTPNNLCLAFSQFFILLASSNIYTVDSSCINRPWDVIVQV
jgi:hypothetical protein